MKILFWISIISLMYIYFGYYLVLALISKFNRKKVMKDENYIPMVSLIISAYNEENIIEEKIKNSLGLDYPKERLEILVSNDGSKDNTASIVSKYKNIKLMDYKINEGKTQAQNKTVTESSGNILIFSDANAMYREDALKKLVANFADCSVGCVCGELKYSKSNDGGAGDGEGLYWRYEKKLKQMESNIYSTLGANGSIYALRRDLYKPLPPDIISDFVEPLTILKKGYRCIYESNAISYEKTEGKYQKELRRKVRIIVRSIRGFLYAKDLMKFNFIGFAMLSHKLLRWMAPIFMIIALISNLLCNVGIYKYLLIAQSIFYLFSLIGLRIRNKFFYIPSYFLMSNYASLKAMIKVINGEKFVSWNTSERRKN